MYVNIKFYFRFILLLTALGLFISCEQKPAKTVEIRGIYGNPKPFWDKDLNLIDLGVNAIFVHSGSIDHDMINRARSEELMVFAEFATLNGKNYVEKHPEAWAINEKGEKVQAASWFMGVCPTEPGFRQYRFDQLRDLLLEYDLDGVWMDYVHWHAQFEDPEPILPETCFCNHCLDDFSKDSGIEIPAMNGELGLTTRRWGAGESASDHEWLTHFMNRMKNEKNRKAKFISVTSFFDGNNLQAFTGETHGTITNNIEAPLKEGIPLSSVFQAEGSSKVYAALTEAEKSKISHRGKALAQLKNWLTKTL